VKADIVLEHLRAWESKHAMPNLGSAFSPSDHTDGTNPAGVRPKRALADNDSRSARSVAGLSAARSGKSMAIFAVEDDAQNGVAHIDGHRTVASSRARTPARRDRSDVLRPAQHWLKTIELMLGLPALSIFDRVANRMRVSFIGPTNPPASRRTRRSFRRSRCTRSIAGGVDHG